MTWLAFYFCAGIILARFVPVSFWGVYLCALFLFSAAWIFAGKGLLFKIFLAGLVIILGAVFFRNNCALPRSHLTRFIFPGNEAIFTARGMVNSRPRMQGARPAFIFAVKELEFYHSRYQARGDILVYLPKNAAIPAYGEALILRGAIHAPFKFYGSKICGVMRVNAEAAVISLRANHGFPLRRCAFFFKEKIERVIFRHVSPLTAAILDAMVLGEKRDIPAVIYDAMVKCGTVHILVVSGFNVGIVAFMIILILKVLRLARAWRYLLAGLALIIYCLATGNSSPVLRATVMAIFFLSGLLLKREPDPGNAFGLAILFILALNPAELFSISFQLSFVSVAGIIFLYPRIRDFCRARSLKPPFLRVVAEGCLLSFSIWAATSGFILFYFKIITPVTVFSNILIAPLAGLITLAAFSLVVVAWVLPGCAGPFAAANELLVAALLALNQFFIRVPFAYLYVA